MRGGFTLLEMLLVLSVLLVLAAIIYPSLQGAYANTRIQHSVEELRIKLAGTRFRAIDSGLVFQFRYEPGGRQYLAIPYEYDSSGEEQDLSVLGVFNGELSEETTFRVADDEPVGAEKLAAGQLIGLDDATSLSKLTWSPPILFFPDGASDAAAFEVTDAQGQFIRVSIRDLTAAVSLSRLERGTR